MTGISERLLGHLDLAERGGVPLVRRLGARERLDRRLPRLVKGREPDEALLVLLVERVELGADDGLGAPRRRLRRRLDVLELVDAVRLVYLPEFYRSR